ncbi:ATP synthase subunit g, mitochondrial-like [Orbicella faveolata]|uniref:ATP synthase subunit g, mitochondrial-like n=1 Tax=Orbicella faveolata TaxID=48498 RepID=UPI0009E5C765|nr:ATP synthase subunit g, mitochondrial-like [Orbicella faveolata]
MAQKLVNFGQKIVTATPRLATRVSFQALGAAKKVQPHVVTFWNNAKVEMLPPKLSEWPAIKKSFIGLKEAALKGKFLDITVKEATVNTLVAVEIAFWFYVGEVIGRRSLIGYNV